MSHHIPIDDGGTPIASSPYHRQLSNQLLNSVEGKMLLHAVGIIQMESRPNDTPDAIMSAIADICEKVDAKNNES